MGALGLFIKTLIAFIAFVRENSKYSETIPKSVLFWCAIGSLFTNIYQYNTILAGNKDITLKDKLITELQHTKADTMIDIALVKEVDELKELLIKCKTSPSTVKPVTVSTSYTRYQQLQKLDNDKK